MTSDDQTILEHQQDASSHEAFEEMPAEAEAAIEAAIEPPDNRFIPRRAEDLMRALGESSSPVRLHPDRLERVFWAMRDVIEQEARAMERRLAVLYHPFWPDADAAPPEVLTETEEHAFLHAFDYLLEKANYEQLTQEHLDEAIATANTYGLNVEIDHDCVRHLRVYVRGRGTMTKRFRSVKAPMKGVEREIEVFKRMALVLSLKDDEHVVLKLFRDIPLADFEALLPNARVRMSTFDRVKVFGLSAGALGGLATKLWGVAIGTTALTGNLLWVAIIAIGGLGIRGFFGWRNTMRQRVGQRTGHLYYRNLANNAGVLTTLLHHVCDEELKEAFLAYAFLAHERAHSEEQLDGRIEAWLKTRFDIDVNFDCPDGVETLGRLGLWRDRSRWEVLGLDDADELLKKHWQHKRSERYHLDAISASGAARPS